MRTRAAGTMKLPAINLSRSSSLVRCISRKAWIAAPAAVSFQNQSPSCRLDGFGGPAAPPPAGAVRRFAAEPIGDVAANIGGGQLARPDGGAAILFHPALMSALQQQHL